MNELIDFPRNPLIDDSTYRSLFFAVSDAMDKAWELKHHDIETVLRAFIVAEEVSESDLQLYFRRLGEAMCQTMLITGVWDDYCRKAQ